MLKRFGITIPQDTRVMRTRNVAAVMVTATIKNFSRKGMKFDVQVSSMGDATSLQGGMLLMTPLTGTDGRVYGMAQGGVSVGGYDFRSNQSRVSKNFVSSGRVPGGAILEIDVEGNILNENSISVLLREPDFTTAQRIAQAINRLPGLNNAAEALDAVAIRVQLPGTPTQSQVMQYITQIEAAQVTVDPAARVVINERTGTIVVGSNVELLPAVISHGGLEIQIQTENSVAMPAPFTIAEPQRVSNSYLSATEEYNKAVVINGTSTVQDMAAALNSLRVTPRDLIAIFQALKESGALQAELIIQ
jgi:flagellar P-ring protein precursor FlgI